MSEQQNVDLIKATFDAFGRGDVHSILSHCTSDCEFNSPGPSSIPYSGPKKGHAEIQSYFDILMRTQKDENLAIEEFVAQGDTVVAIGRYTATVRSTGKPINTPVILVFHVHEGKIARHMVLGDTAAVAASYTGTTIGAA